VTIFMPPVTEARGAGRLSATAEGEALKMARMSAALEPSMSACTSA
jgi:hypothetical protein